jgi:hypothetical protein
MLAYKFGKQETLIMWRYVTATVMSPNRRMDTRTLSSLLRSPFQEEVTRKSTRQLYSENRGDTTEDGSGKSTVAENRSGNTGQQSANVNVPKTFFYDHLSIPTKQVLEQAKAKTAESARSIQLRTKEWLESSRPVAAAAFNRARELARLSLKNAGQGAVSAASGAGRLILQKVQQGTSWAVRALQTKVMSLTYLMISAVRDKMRSAVSILTRPIERINQNFRQGVDQLAPGNLWNKFFWWSLAAVGVYGVATTVPREIVRQQLSSRAQDHINEDSVDKN